MKTVKIDICCCAKCTMLGSIEIMEHVDELKADFPDAEFTIELLSGTDECREHSSNAPVVVINSKKLVKATPQKVMEEILGVIR